MGNKSGKSQEAPDLDTPTIWPKIRFLGNDSSNGARLARAWMNEELPPIGENIKPIIEGNQSVEYHLSLNKGEKVRVVPAFLGSLPEKSRKDDYWRRYFEVAALVVALHLTSDSPQGAGEDALQQLIATAKSYCDDIQASAHKSTLLVLFVIVHPAAASSGTIAVGLANQLQEALRPDYGNIPTIELSQDELFSAFPKPEPSSPSSSPPGTENQKKSKSKPKNDPEPPLNAVKVIKTSETDATLASARTCFFRHLVVSKRESDAASFYEYRKYCIETDQRPTGPGDRIQSAEALLGPAPSTTYDPMTYTQNDSAFASVMVMYHR